MTQHGIAQVGPLQPQGRVLPVPRLLEESDLVHGRLLRLQLADSGRVHSPGLDLVILKFWEYAAGLEAICVEGRASDTLQRHAEGLASCARLLRRCADTPLQMCPCPSVSCTSLLEPLVAEGCSANVPCFSVYTTCSILVPPTPSQF
jgi:hypothetical protein